MSDEPTTPDLVQVTRGFFDSASRGDLDETLAFCSPDVVFDMSAVGLGTYVGSRAVRGFWEDWLSAYEESEIELEESVDLGSGIVLVVFHQHARPAGSTGQVQVRTTWVYEWADATIKRVTNYPTVDEARVAAERLAEERG